MNEEQQMSTMSHEGTTTTARAATMQPPAPFVKPRPGSWMLDAAHCERPLPRFVTGVFEASFSRGFREGLAAYGALLETIEVALVNGFVYSCVRPIGAPPEPKGLPPKAIFKLLTRTHPEIRRRVRRSEESMNTQLWREEKRRYDTEWAPPLDREAERLYRTRLEELDDEGLARHVRDCYQHLLDATYLHHRMNCSRIIPVGDFMAHARQWTGASFLEMLETLRGASPDSRSGLAELDALARLVRTDDATTAMLAGGADPEEIIGALERRDDAIGQATRRWIETVGHNLTGFSPGYPTLRETPSTLVEALRATLRPSQVDDAAMAGRRAFERLRARVPEEHRAAFDALYKEARDIYGLRDHLAFHTLRSNGTVRLGLLEAGRRLALRGRIHEPEAALEATSPELCSMLIDGSGPTADELQRHLEWRRTVTSEDVPELLGPAPGAPPPDDWLPVGARRLQRAVSTYIEAMSNESRESGSRAVVRGLSASGGKRTGVARLVLEPGDFDRIEQGDILVARITTPAFNILLPLLSGIVTDRGGVLSHPAIVSREYGIPGVVGTRNATSLIADGALVEIDGDAGTVKVLS
jgi:rifampicin phosphotransferase